MRRNSMTEKSCLVTDERDFVVEKQRLRESIDLFATGGPGVCTKHPHFFFGPLTPVEWAVLMYQHLDAIYCASFGFSARGRPILARIFSAIWIVPGMALSNGGRAKLWGSEFSRAALFAVFEAVK